MRFSLITQFAWFFLSLTAHAATDFSVTSGLSEWNQTEWSLTTNTFNPGQFQARASLANGYVGGSLAAAGPFFEIDVNQTDANGLQPTNGWPLFDPRFSFFGISGFYNIQENGTGTNYPWLNQYGWESFIAGVPHATGLIFAFGDDYYDATVSNTSVSNFASKLSFKTGVQEWASTWTLSSGTASLNLTFTAFFSRERPNVVAVKATITPSEDINGTITDLLDGRSAARSYLNEKGLDTNTSSIYSSVHPDGLANITGYLVSGVNFSNPYTDLSSRAKAQGNFVSTNDSTVGQTFNISLKAGETATFYKFIGVASNDKFSDPSSVARDAQAAAQSDGWDVLLQEHTDAWAKILTEDSVDDFRDKVTGELPDDPNILALQIASVANAYYLLQNIQPEGSGLNDNSVAVGGLASDSYGGLIFWDADYWMAPGLNIAFPQWAKQIPNFRVKQHQQALENAAFNGFPNGSALYSWTAGRYGNCTGTGPCADYEYHLNPDLAFNMFQLRNTTNDETWFNNGSSQVIESVATALSALLEFNETTQTYWIHNMTDPDEYANNVDNGAFTVASAGMLLKAVNDMKLTLGQPINETWQDQYEKIDFPRAPSNITLEYQTMNDSVAVKQADVVLLTYPLDFGLNYTDDMKLLDLDYYANKQSPDGPAMTYSVFAVDANVLSPSGTSAYTYMLNGNLPYLRAPWYQFSEQAVDDYDLNGGTNPAFPFLTGHGGSNQVVPFGLLGLRTDQSVLYVDPALPGQIPYVSVRNIYFAGATISASINATHTNITRLATPSSANLVDRYANGSMPLIVGAPNSPGSVPTSYNLTINQTITVPNRLYWKNLTYANNLLQSLPVSSPDKYAAGQFPEAAIDGATATRWQPATNDSAALLVNMTSVSPSPISGAYFDFGARPPINITIIIGNLTDGSGGIYGNEIQIDVFNIAPNLPYDAATAAASSQNVVPVQGNSTTVAILGGAYSGEYMRLEMVGCWENDGMGATIGEVVLIGGD